VAASLRLDLRVPAGLTVVAYADAVIVEAVNHAR
jgi:hypothetical protein